MPNIKQNTILYPDGNESVDLMPQTIPSQIDGLNEFLMQYITENFELNGIIGITTIGYRQGTGTYEGYTETMIELNTDKENIPFSVYAKNGADGSGEGIIDLSNFKSINRIRLETTLEDDNNYGIELRNNGYNKGIRIADVKSNSNIRIIDDQVSFTYNSGNNSSTIRLNNDQIYMRISDGDNACTFSIYKDGRVRAESKVMKFVLGAISEGPADNLFYVGSVTSIGKFEVKRNGQVQVNGKYVGMYSYRKLFKLVSADNSMGCFLSFLSDNDDKTISHHDVLLCGYYWDDLAEGVVWDTDILTYDSTKIYFGKNENRTLYLSATTMTVTGLGY